MAIFHTDTGSIKNLVVSGNLSVSGAASISGTLNVTNGITGSLLGTASWAENFVSASNYLLSSQTSSFVTNSQTSSFVTNSQTASFATTGSNTFNGSQIISGSLTVTQNLTVLGSASVTYISESQLNIETNLITVNTINPGARFGGLAVIDSGSSPLVSASFLYDSIQDEFLFVHKGNGVNVTSSIFLLGPETYDSVGNEIYIAQNRILKSQGNEHVTASNISDNGSIVSIVGALSVTGVITGSISGSVIGYVASSQTSSFITNAQTSSFVTNSQTSSFVTNAQTSSFVNNNQTASFATTGSNTFEGDQTISGSLTVTSSLSVFGNEFVVNSTGVKLGNVITDVHSVTGSLNVSGSITASLFGTASWAINALTASFVSNAFVQGGNSFGATALLGTNDTQNLQLETSGVVRLTISSSGGVGIGTNPTNAPLTINNPSTIGGTNITGAAVLIGTISAGLGIDTNEIYTTGSDLNMGTLGPNSIFFRVNSADTPITAMSISASGETTMAKLGIGTVPTNALLTINSPSTISGSNITGAAVLIGTVSSGLGIDTNEIYTTGSDLIMGTLGPDDILLKTSGSLTRIFIDGDTGNVGINNASPNNRLDVTGTGRFSNGLITSGNVNIANGFSVVWNDDNNTFPTSVNNRIRWELNADNAEIYAHQPTAENLDLVFKVSDNINVGSGNDEFVFWVDDFQGESFDAYPLTMNGTEFIVNAFRRYAATGSNSGSGDVDFYVLRSGSLSLNDSVLFANAGNGRVGIGTSSPAFAFDVSGSGRFTGGLTVSGSLNISGAAVNNTGFILTYNTASGLVSYTSSAGIGGGSGGPETDPIFTARSASLATTGSNTFRGDQSINGTLTTTASVSFTGGDVSITTGSTNYLRIFPGGNVFVGPTAVDGGFRLDVNGTTRLQGALSVSTGGASIVGATNINGATTITGSTTVSGSARITNALTASFGLFSSSLAVPSSSILSVYGSGSDYPAFVVRGSQGELFSVTDSLTGSLFSVNNISGLPIFEVFSDNTTLIGTWPVQALYTTTKITANSSSLFSTVYSVQTNSYDGLFADYTIRSGSNARAGQIMTIWSGSETRTTDVATTSFGNTSNFEFTSSVVGGELVLQCRTNSNSWSVKTIIRSI
jgi:hypothetical protein